MEEVYGQGGAVAVLEAPSPVAATPPNAAEVVAVSAPRSPEEASADLVAQAAESLRIHARRNEIAALVGSVGMSYAYAEVVQRVEATEIPVRTALFLVTGIR